MVNRTDDAHAAKHVLGLLSVQLSSHKEESVTNQQLLLHEQIRSDKSDFAREGEFNSRFRCPAIKCRL